MTSAPKTLIELREAGVCYYLRSGVFGRKNTEFWALRDVSMTLHAGDRLAIIGRNGAGKSTLALVLAGLLHPDAGTIRLRRPVTRQLLSLRPGFEDGLTGEENAILGGLYLGRTLSQMKRILPRIAEVSDLDEFFYQPLETYSSGMRARLGFAVAMSATPDILFLDEVLGTVGDDAFKQKSADLMKQKLESGIKAAVIISHDRPTLSHLCNRAIVIDKGRILHDGSVEDAMACYNEVIERHKIESGKQRRRLPQRSLAPHLRLLRALIDRVCQ
jgi:lipopolysaccharide transport system ATP-binding protein